MPAAAGRDQLNRSDALPGEADVAFALNRGCTILDVSSKRFAVPTRRSSKYAVALGTFCPLSRSVRLTRLSLVGPSSERFAMTSFHPEASGRSPVPCDA